jgi:hypothetical protein
VDRDHSAIGDREDVLSEAIVTLAQSMAKVSAVSMRTPSIATRRSLWTLGLQQAVVASQPFPLRGGLMTMAGLRLIATSGALTSRLSTIKATFESALSV